MMNERTNKPYQNHEYAAATRLVPVQYHHTKKESYSTRSRNESVCQSKSITVSKSLPYSSVQTTPVRTMVPCVL